MTSDESITAMNLADWRKAIGLVLQELKPIARYRAKLEKKLANETEGKWVQKETAAIEAVAKCMKDEANEKKSVEKKIKSIQDLLTKAME